METNELVKALRDCTNKCDCATCEYRNVSDKIGEKFCFDVLMDRAADRIEKQDVEIKALRGAAGSLKAALEDAQKSIEVFGQANAALRDKVPEWIPVSERLPEPEKMVLLIVSGKIKNISFVDAYDLGEFDTDEGWILEMWPEWKDHKVTHWMPLPELPEEEKHEK